MTMIKERHKVVINKFQELLRCGKDYSVMYMYEEAGKEVYMKGYSTVRVINRYYSEIITQEMIDFVSNLTCKRKDEIEQFAKRFNVCTRESVLLIRYIRRRNG